MMRKTMFFALAAMVLLSASCKKENTGNRIASTFLNVSFEEGDEDVKVSFSGVSGTKTVTVWDATDKLWVRSDRQPLWENGVCFTTSASAISDGGKSAKFSGTVRTDGSLAAVYPFRMVDYSAGNGELVLKLAKSYPVAKSSCPKETLAFAAFSSNGSVSLTMSPLFGAVKFSLTGSGQKVTSLELTDAVATNCLWGDCTVVPDYAAGKVKSIAVSNDAPDRHKAVLTCPQALVLSAAPTDFYFTLPEGALAEGFTLTVLFEGGSSKDFPAGGNVVKKGSVVLMPVIDCAN